VTSGTRECPWGRLRARNAPTALAAIDGFLSLAFVEETAFTVDDECGLVAGEPSLAQDDPDVMFQETVYEGLVGNAFLSRFAVAYDVPGAQMIFGPRP
jgi:hypothetical protein